MEKEVVEIYRKTTSYKTHYFDRCSPYEVVIIINIFFVRVWWKRFINFLLSPFTTHRIKDFRGLYDISVSKPNFEYSNIETEYFEDYEKEQKEIAEKWFKESSEAAEIIKHELIKYKYKNRLW